MNSLEQYISKFLLLTSIFLMVCPKRSIQINQFRILSRHHKKIHEEIIKRELIRKFVKTSRPDLINKIKQRQNMKDTMLVKNAAAAKPSRRKNFTETQEFISFSKTSKNIKNDGIIQLRIVRDSQGRDLVVKSANLIVKVKYPVRHNVNGTKRRRHNKARKISLFLSTVKENNKPKDIIASITKIKIRKTAWFRLKIPEMFMQNVLDSDKESIRLHIMCKGCNSGAKLVLGNNNRRQRKFKRTYGYRLLETKSKRKHKKKRNPRRNRKRTPFLILHTKMKTYLGPKLVPKLRN